LTGKNECPSSLILVFRGQSLDTLKDDKRGEQADSALGDVSAGAASAEGRCLTLINPGFVCFDVCVCKSGKEEDCTNEGR
jgi:hypothetical protein